MVKFHLATPIIKEGRRLKGSRSQEQEQGRSSRRPRERKEVQEEEIRGSRGEEVRRKPRRYMLLYCRLMADRGFHTAFHTYSLEYNKFKLCFLVF